ncbi:MAG: hypothetical protein AAF218_08670, partial [Pseudomonadota bacterium]
MKQLPAQLMARPAWQRFGTAALLGAVASMGQAPLGWSPVLAVAIALAIWLSRAAAPARRAGLFGLALGFGYFAVTLAWIVEPFFVDAARHGWMAPFALIFLALGMALFWRSRCSPATAGKKTPQQSRV